MSSSRCDPVTLPPEERARFGLHAGGRTEGRGLPGLGTSRANGRKPKTRELLPVDPDAFTLLEMLVATAVFAMLMMILLQMTSNLMSGATRMDEGLKMGQDVRLFFDILRRDLAQARIGTIQNQFYGTATKLTFVSSSQRLKTEYVSDQRLVTYFLSNNTIRRSVVDPTTVNFPYVWYPLAAAWWDRTDFKRYVETNNEVVLSGVYPGGGNLFSYFLADGTGPVGSTGPPEDATKTPRGVRVNFNLYGKRAIKTGQTNFGNIRPIEYDVDMNIPPVFNP